MAIGTVFILSPSPRSNWYPALLKYLNLDVDVVTDKNDSTFLENFPLKNFPSFLGSDGFKVTESIAILDYLVSLAPNSKLFGESVKDRAQVLRWLSFFNSDFADCGSIVWFKHKSEEEKKISSDKLINYLKYIDNELSNRKYLVLENRISVGEMAAFVCVNHFAKFVGGIDSYPNIIRWKNELINENIFFASLQ